MTEVLLDGVRNTWKFFFWIYKSEEKVNTQAIHINRTVAHLVDKIKFFITAQYKLKTKFNLTGLVGFTDTRSKYRPFQIFKYIGDNFGQEYDYYFFGSDQTYMNINRIKDIVNAVSVSMDVYLGTRESDSSFCNLGPFFRYLFFALSEIGILFRCWNYYQ